MTPENCATETERLIGAALYHRRTVYMAFPSDHATSPIIGTAEPQAEQHSDPDALAAAMEAVLGAIAGARTACVLPGKLVARVGAKAHATHFVTALHLPFATMFAGKCLLDDLLPY